MSQAPGLSAFLEKHRQRTAAGRDNEDGRVPEGPADSDKQREGWVVAAARDSAHLIHIGANDKLQQSLELMKALFPVGCSDERLLFESTLLRELCQLEDPGSTDD